MDALIGTVPDAWSEVPLATVCAVKAGPSDANVRRDGHVQDGVPLVAPRNIRNGRIVIDDLRHLPKSRAEALIAYRLAEGDVLCTRTGALARCARAESENTGWCFASGLVRLRVRDPERIDSRYLLHYMRLPVVVDWIDRNSTGSAIPSVGTQVMGTIPVLLPPLHVQQSIGRTLGVLEDKIDVHERIGRTTAELRDRLAPLLITGRIAGASE